MMYRNIYLYMSDNYLKLNYFKKMTENGPFAVSVKIGIKDNKKRMLLNC